MVQSRSAMRKAEVIVMKDGAVSVELLSRALSALNSLREKSGDGEKDVSIEIRDDYRVAPLNSQRRSAIERILSILSEGNTTRRTGIMRDTILTIVEP